MTSMKYQNDVWTDCLEELNAQFINCRPRFSITRYAKLLRVVLAASGKKLITVFFIAHSNPYKRDVQCHLHSNGRRRYRELLEVVS